MYDTARQRAMDLVQTNGQFCSPSPVREMIAKMVSANGGQTMAALEGRGYLLVHTGSFLRDALGVDEFKRVIKGLSPQLQELVGEGRATSAGWYPMSFLNELNRVTTGVVGQGDEQKARDALFKCGMYISREASNTFLRLMFKLITPKIFLSKVPQLFARDFTSGRFEMEQGERKVKCRIYDVPGFEHACVTSSGFVATGLESLGKKVENITVQNWSLKDPNVDGAGFELTWRD
jgi:hypothetical protein